jgi:16S rRNA (adenine1518-N6/adenine1519-N6)-dimethyltransferase
LSSSLRRDVAARLAALGITLDPDRRDQHLLVDEGQLRRLLDAADVPSDATVLDIGAGPGTIADALASSVAHVFALEVDWRFAPLLREVAERRGNITVTFGDARLQLPEAHAIVASPPWGLLEQLARSLLVRPVETATMITSPAFAAAATAVVSDAAFGRTSVLVRSRFAAEVIGTVEPGAFLPEPRRPGALLRLERDDTSRERRAFARALAHPGKRRVRDLAASVGVRLPSGVGAQRRLQQLTSGDIAAIWEALD